MGAVKKLIDKKVLRDLVPLNALSALHIDEISRKSIIEEIRNGKYVFKAGDRDHQSVYLLEGTVSLLGEGRELVATIKAGTDAARHPLAHKQPRQLSARAEGTVTVARIDSSLLDVLLTWDESAGYDVAEIGVENDNDDWMTRMLQSQAFLQLPPSNIHQLLMRLEAVSAKAGQTIVRQGDDGDYFYIVKSGRLAVTRKASARSKEVLLAELGEGTCFGEEALVSGATRNASVTMITDGDLMRLSKDDFNELLCASLVHEVDFQRAVELVGGGAQWLDVRLPGEFRNQSIKGSTNLPLSALRDHAGELDSETTYVLCCDTGRRSATGAFVLSQRGFDVYTLRNGLMDVPDEVLTSPQQKAPEPAGGRDAEIIPFGADGKSAGDSGAPQPEKGDPQAQARLQAIEQELEAVKTQLRDAQVQHERQQAEAREAGQLADSLQQQLQQAEQRIADAQSEAETGRGRSESLEQENHSLREELARLQQTLAQIQESAEGRDDALRSELQQMADRLEEDRQRNDRQRRDLEQELDKVRDDYQQLGQRASALAGERDAAAKNLEKTERDLEELRGRLSSQAGESDEQLESLRRTLEERQGELDAAHQQSEALETRVGELQADVSALRERLDAAGQQADQQQAANRELECSLEQSRQKIEDLEKLLNQAGEREVGLQGSLQHSEEAARQALEKAQAEATRHQQQLQQQVDTLRSELDAHKTAREELEARLAEAESALRGAEGADQQNLEKLRTAEERLAQLEQDLEHARQAEAGAQRHSDETASELAESRRQLAELNDRLARTGAEHESDLSSVRGALSRAQEELENVNREQSRLLESLRKAERNLQRERDDHDIEIRRLRKELEESAGESSAGLAAELEAMQQQLKELAVLRDELEIQLGERSAQMENAQAQAARLEQQLEQARESARQAEQQLVDANQAANEEMQVRLEAEQRAQQLLREQLEAVTTERNSNQERVTVLQQQIDELSDAVQDARSAAATAQDQTGQELTAARQELDGLRDALQQFERERDAAREAEQAAREEADRLRAETEVTRGLIDMQGHVVDVDGTVFEEVEQAKKNVEIAVRLRGQAEQQVAELQREVDNLRARLAEHGISGNDADMEPVEIATLGDGESAVAALMQGDGDEWQGSDDDEDVARPQAVEEAQHASSVVTADSEERRSSSLAWLLALVALIGLAGGGYWWFGQRPAETPRGDVSEPLSDGKPEYDAAESALQAGDAAPGVDVETPGAAEDAPTADPRAPWQSAAQQRSETAPEAPTASAAEQSAQPEPSAQPPSQPAGSFRDRLAVGNSGPFMVEFHADEFEMGSSSMSQHFDERPRHTVKLPRFAISRNEVTFEDYDRFASATGRRRPSDEGWGRGKRPVINVSWDEAVAYTRWLSEQTGHRYRLPSESEWEFAARAGSRSRYWWGNEPGQGNANCFNCGGEWAGRSTAPVGSFPASDFGVHDMAGNAREWVQDCYQDSYANAPADGGAVDVPGCGERVARGGSFSSSSQALRSTSRERYSPDSRLDDLGFRVVREF